MKQNLVLCDVLFNLHKKRRIIYLGNVQPVDTDLESIIYQYLTILPPIHNGLTKSVQFQRTEHKSIQKPVKKEYKVKLKQLFQNLEATLPLFFQYVGNIEYEYQAIQNIKDNLIVNDVLIHEEIQAVHFGEARQQITMHIGPWYLHNNRHDTLVVCVE